MCVCVFFSIDIDQSQQPSEEKKQQQQKHNERCVNTNKRCIGGPCGVGDERLDADEHVEHVGQSANHSLTLIGRRKIVLKYIGLFVFFRVYNKNKFVNSTNCKQHYQSGDFVFRFRFLGRTRLK